MTDKTPVYIAFQGGGALGMAHIGAWKAISKEFDIKGVAGTSAGSIVAAFCAAGFTPEHTIEIFNQLNWSKYVKRQGWLQPLIKLLIKKDGFSDGENFRKWLRDKLKENIDSDIQDIRFNFLYDKTKIYLAIVACNLNGENSERRVVIFDKKQRPNDFVSHAVRASISIPMFFNPVENRNLGEVLVDGGLLLNYPIKLLYKQAQEENCALIGVRFKEKPNYLENPSAWRTSWQSVQIMQQVGNEPPEEITKYPNYIEIVIDVKDFNFLEFNLTKDKKDKLVKRGVDATERVLDKWKLQQQIQYPKEIPQPKTSEPDLPLVKPVDPQLLNVQRNENQQYNLGDKLSNETKIYIERPPTEERCYNAILQPGVLIRIKAPQKRGKTLLLGKLLNYAGGKGYKAAKLDLKLADINILSDLKTFLQWLCTDVADSLEQEPQLDKYRQDIYSINKNCTRYFEKYILPSTESPLVLAIDNFERLFEYPEIFPQFCLLLRGWYETAKRGDKIGNLWRKLRLVIVHSTEAYPDLDTNHSPFNVGELIELPEFNLQQVKSLALQLELDSQLVEQSACDLMGLVGGHPYLVQQAIAYLKNQQVTLEEILRIAPTEQGIFSNHLRQQLWSLQHNHELEIGYKQVVMANSPVQLDTEVAFKLHSLGLVKLSGNDCVPSCNLYRQYFSVHLR